MNTFQFSSLPMNPFTRPNFWGRRNELDTIYGRLFSRSPQCIPIIGEPYIGKTSLLCHLMDTQDTPTLRDQQKVTFVYLDCKLTIDRTREDYASVSFWWNLYHEAQPKLQPKQPAKLTEPELNTNLSLIDSARQIKVELDRLIQAHDSPVIFLLDNYELIARLPLYNSWWLRAMTLSKCAYVVTSRHLLYLHYQYHPENWENLSPLWNLFSDPVYLGLLPEREVEEFLLQAKEQSKELGSIWKKCDIDFIRRFAGRHAELIRLACKNLFDQRLSSQQFQAIKKDESDESNDDYESLEFSISRDASAMCYQLWQGLADPELSGIPRIEGQSRDEEILILSPHQKALLAVAHDQVPTEKNILYLLEQRGLLEQAHGSWRVFAEVMKQYTLKQEQVYSQATSSRERQALSDVPPVSSRKHSSRERRKEIVFTYLEGKVYDYLKAHVGEVCDRTNMKLAVWEDNLPSDTALQKIIERIRDKIETDANNPRYLIAVRGQGYILREEPPAPT